MTWSDISPLDDGLRAIVTWHTPGGPLRMVGRIEVTAHRAAAMLHPEPHGHELPGSPPAEAIEPPPAARVHVVGFPGERTLSLIGGIL